MNLWDTIIITPFINVLLAIYQFVGHNFGIAIVLFTILMRLVTHPLTVQQIKGSSGITELNKDPDWQAIQKKYKGDKEKLAQEQMRIYKEKGINPMASCLPTLIQFPIIIGLYQALIRSLASTPMELLDFTRHIYPVLLKTDTFIPLNSQFLWMDLGMPERLNLGFIPFGIPILAVIVTITSFLQTKLITPPSDPSNPQGAMMSNTMSIYMPLLMGYMAYTLSSGLALYFFVSNVVGILQYAFLGKLNLDNLFPNRKKQIVKSK
ncbi:MAG: membrane protein insertase YidC [Anaerolineaceae bacterium]|nr:membrane protein insertase YidC [Anaerolineaceae bacterium]